MGVVEAAARAPMDDGLKTPGHFEGISAVRRWVAYGAYALSLGASICIWFIAIRSPLWLDETGSYWEIKDGFSQIWSRQTLSFPAYSYILWLWTKVFGTSELALRTPSVLAMLGAVCLLYLIARELFDHETSIIALIVFCVNPIVIFTSIDARPYAFAALMTNAAILALLRMRNNDSNWLAAVFGVMAAGILYFHYLFAVILPALVLCFFLTKRGARKTLWRQFGVAACAFALACLPLFPGLRYLFNTSGSHSVERAPTALDLATTLAPGWLPFVFVAVALVALIIAALRPMAKDSPKLGDVFRQIDRPRILVCVFLALIPILLLYGVSRGTSIQIFAARHRLVGILGISLCWALVVANLFKWRAARLVFCATLVAATAVTHFYKLREHDPTWKYALAVAEKNASPDNAPVVVCSPFIEGAYVAVPANSAKDSRYFAPLSYYKLSVPVVPMPYSLNDEAMRAGSQFLAEASQRHERFLALGDEPSYPLLDWFAQRASGSYVVRKLGVFDQTEVLEFVPRLTSH